MAEEKQISRQQVYQRRMLAENRCIICGDNAVAATRPRNGRTHSCFCFTHLIANRERQRARGLKTGRRNRGSGSYRLEGKL